jgi:NAD(P)-dependent dehydrogenase (short-subunit alcohol dehydrogenase family)
MNPHSGMSQFGSSSSIFAIISREQSKSTFQQEKNIWRISSKNVRDQVIVITGASSGIGLATARMAAENGARLVLAARSSNALRELADEITRRGGAAIHVAADVGKLGDVREIARAAEDRFGGFDTWVNNAAVAIYGKLLEISVEDMRRLVETNFWGTVYGSLEAARYLRRRGGGPHQYRQHAIRPRASAAGHLQRVEARRQSVHRRAAYGAGRGGRQNISYPHQARRHRHALHAARAQLHGFRGAARAARLCAGDGRARRFSIAQKPPSATFSSAPAARRYRRSGSTRRG